MKRASWIAPVLGLLLVTWFFGCMQPPETTTELTPEQIQAQKDSIAKANEKELKKWRMFAFDKVKEQNWLKAREYFWKVVDLDVNHQYNDWAFIYRTYTETSDMDSAQVVLGMGLEYHPNDAFLNSTLGFFKMKQGDNEEAYQLYCKAVEVEPENVEYLEKKAELEEALDMPDEAIASWEQVVAMAPDNQSAKDRLTSLVKRHRDPEEYIAALEADLVANPEDMFKHRELLLALNDQGLNERVVEQADKMLAIDATYVDAYRYKAASLENLNKLGDAITTYEKLLEVQPDAGWAMLRIADNKRLLNQFSSARSWVLKAREANVNPQEANFTLGMIFESAGDKCSPGGVPDYNDKLTYVIAYGLYRQAVDGNDYGIKDKADRRIEFLKQFIPSYSDWFMNQTKKRPAKSCYDWINDNWSEVRYIDTYLGQVEKSK